MIRASLISLLCLLLVPTHASARPAGPPVVIKKNQVRDLAAIRSSKVLRVLVNQSRNSSGEVKGEPVGIEYCRLQAFEKYLNGHARDGQKITLKLIPKAKDQLLAALQRGEGDLVAPGELLDASAARYVDATEPVASHVPLVVVGVKGERSFKHPEQLSGRTLMLTSGSAADAAIIQLNQKLALRKLPPVKIEWVDPSLAVEDVLEMVQAGIYHLTVVEQPIAERWAKVMPRLRLDRSVALSDPGDMNWFVRKDAVMLHAAVNRFLETYEVPGNQDVAFQKAYKDLYQIHNPLARADRLRLEKLRPTLQLHADAQKMDWLDLAALAFKESALNPGAKGGSGATGLLQITPSAAQRVGVGNIHDVDGNVQAASKYLAMIRRKFFSSPKINERERMAFTLAAYNLGPERVQAMRTEARRQGLNPNQWFFQVERVAMEQGGKNVVSYVNSVNKYYLAYDQARSSLEDPDARPR
ncbi:transglycosylase SLT domain-containing protein [Pseudomonas sp. NFR16]|uniref:transglycosylase SLT domain-containing protein n=1 Tax=Pseudomonas sp. NFR16 TaxID=1566248 RepID=UPI0008BE088C|nr:transglycosylase SLT domain-containing protein [Pseudomonas sp. NFR16]SEI71818.1 Membrane-bound lytic murein transglycosylase MltF [Pseudomonas sp. NFR16]